MKRKKSYNKTKLSKRKKHNYLIVDMTPKQDIRIIPPNYQEKEEDFKKISEITKKQTDEMKDMYYSSNLQISNIKNRTFFDLFKKFIHLKFSK